MAQLGIVTNFSSIAQKVIVVWYNSAAPLAEVGRIVKNTPHLDGDVITVTGLDTTVYTFKFFESSDGVALDTLLSAWSVEVKDSKQVVNVYDYFVDGGRVDTDWADPVSGQDFCDDARFRNADQVILMSEGGGLRIEGVNYDLLYPGHPYLTGGSYGWRLKNGEVFAADEKWKAIVIKSVDTQSTSSNTADYSDIKIVDTDGAFDSTYYNKNNVADFGTNLGTTTFPAFSTIPDKTKARFSTFIASQRYWILQFSAGDTIHYKGEDRNVIYLGIDESIEIIFKSSVGYVINHNTDYDIVGQRRLVDKQADNDFLLDGTQYNIADVPRLSEFIASLPAAQKTNNTGVWNANKHLWFYDTVSVPNVFKVPDDRNMFYRSLKTFDGVADATRSSNVPGGYQADAVGAHDHTYVISATTSPTGGTKIYGLNGPSSPTAGHTSVHNAGGETTVKNAGQLAVVRI